MSWYDSGIDPHLSSVHTRSWLGICCLCVSQKRWIFWTHKCFWETYLRLVMAWLWNGSGAFWNQHLSGTVKPVLHLQTLRASLLQGPYYHTEKNHTLGFNHHTMQAEQFHWKVRLNMPSPLLLVVMSHHFNHLQKHYMLSHCGQFSGGAFCNFPRKTYWMLWRKHLLQLSKVFSSEQNAQRGG